jgi:hypothetical protein
MKKNISVLGGAVLALAVFSACDLDELEESTNEEKKNDTPTQVKEGASFVHDDFGVSKGWKVSKDALGLVEISGMKVTNKSDEDRRDALLTFRLYKGKDVLSEITCTSNQMQAGETSPMDCFSGDDYPKGGYASIKVSDAF